MKRTVFVSGASSGLGRAVAEYLACHGYNVYAGARSFINADTAPKGCIAVPLDVTDDDSVKQAFSFVLDKEKEIYALVNCAAFFITGSCEEVSADDVDRVMKTNFIGTVRNTQTVLPAMRKQGYGRIINFSSINGILAIPFQGAYTASKHAIEGWSEALSQEVRRFGIKVTVVEPGDCRGGSQKYRNRSKASGNPASPYYEYYTAGIEKIDHDEANGMEQVKIASAVSRLLDKRNPPSRKLIASLAQRPSVWLKTLLPRTMFDKIITSYYSPRKTK